jgi:hypothetical protein
VSSNAVLGCSFARNGVAGAGVLPQQKGGRAGEQVARHIGDNLSRAARQVHRDKVLKRRRAENQRAEFRRAGHVVPDPLTRLAYAFSGELQVGIERGHVAAGCGVGQVEPCAGQPLITNSG